MPSVFIADVPEFEPVWRNAGGDPTLEVLRVGPYVELRFQDAVTIDRRATGCRHAVWYSCIGGVRDATVVQFDQDALRVEAR
jgi:hypothetical protein